MGPEQQGKAEAKPTRTSEAGKELAGRTEPKEPGSSGLRITPLTEEHTDPDHTYAFSGYLDKVESELAMAETQGCTVVEMDHSYSQTLSDQDKSPTAPLASGTTSAEAKPVGVMTLSEKRRLPDAKTKTTAFGTEGPRELKEQTEVSPSGSMGPRPFRIFVRPHWCRRPARTLQRPAPGRTTLPALARRVVECRTPR